MPSNKQPKSPQMPSRRDEGQQSAPGAQPLRRDSKVTKPAPRPGTSK